MPDVFDAVAEPPAAPAGDVFDQVATATKPPPDIFDQISKPAPETVLKPAPEEGFWHSVGRELRESASPLLGPTEQQQLNETYIDDKGNPQYKPMADSIEREGFIPALSRPFVPIPKASANRQDSGWTATGKAVYNAATGLMEFAESPLGIATGGAGVTPSLARATKAAFAADMLSNTPKDVSRLRQAYRSGTTQEQIEAGLGLTGDVVLGGGLGAEAVRGERPAPKAAPAPGPSTERVASSEFAEPAPPAPAASGATPPPVVDLQTGKATAGPPPNESAVQAQMVSAPVERVPSEAIATRPDLMQFKRSDDAEAGTNKGDELSGKWNDLKGGNLLLWEPSDPRAYGLEDGEKYIVANGHHRFEFGESQDVPSYNAQIVRESDGVSAQDVRKMAAEINIADGKGTIFDQVKYLRNESGAMTPAEQLAKVGPRGAQAVAIASQAGDDLYDSFVNERIKPDTAQAIASAAPVTRQSGGGVPPLNSPDSVNASLQRLGIRKAVDGAGPQEVSNLIGAVRLEAGQMTPDQLDLFGANDSALTAAETLAKTATRIQNELSREIKATESAAKSASTARAKGISFDRPPEEILAENAQLKGERQRWDNWALHPDLVAQARGYAEMKRKVAPNLEFPEVDAALGPGPRRGLNRNFVQTIADDVRAKLPGIGPVHVVQHLADVPEHYQASIQSEGRLTGGFLDRDTGHAWVIADHLRDEKHARDVILEETLGHDGMQRFLRDGDYADLARTITATKPETAARLARLYRLDLNDPADRRTLVNEYVAREASRLDEKQPFFQRLADVLLRGLSRAGLLGKAPRARVLDAQMRALTRKAIRQLAARPAAGQTPASNWTNRPGRPDSNLSLSQEETTPPGAGSQDERPLRQFGVKVRAAPEISPDVKTGVTEYSYTPKPNETTAAAATRILQQRGLDNAIAAYKDQRTWDGNGATQSALGKLLIKSMADQERVARASGDTITSRELIGKQVDLVDHDLRRSTDVAQALQAMSLWGRMTPEGIVAHGKRTIEGAGDAVMRRNKATADNIKGVAEKANADALDDFKHDRQVNEATRKAVDATVAEDPDVHKAVIMELAGPWSESPAILAAARERVRLQANEILAKAPAEPGVPASKRLKIILDDLSARAANIAANHYQGAEPGVLLKDKLKQRLGLSEEKAVQMAKAFDKEFANQVAAAKAKLPKRIAAQRAKAEQPYNPADVSDTAVDKEIRRQLKAQQTKLGDVLNKTAAERNTTGKSIGDRVVDAAQLNGDPVELRAVFNRRWEALVGARQRAALEALVSRAGMRGGRTIRAIWERVVKMSNLGAFSDQRYYEAVREALKLPRWTPEIASELQRRANDLQRQPEGFQRDRATIDMLNMIEKHKGVKLTDLPMAMWYANTLSGLTTPVHVLVDNIGSIAGNLAATAMRQPRALPGALRAAGRGVPGGLREAAAILKTGYVTGLSGNLYTSHILERNPFTGPLRFLNAAKYVGRALSATHVSTFKPAWEIKSFLTARDTAKSEGLTGAPLQQRVTDLLANTDARVLAAQTQAAGEGLRGLDATRRTREIIEQQREQNLPGLTDQARDFALRATYLDKPYGAIGWMAEKYNEGVQRASESNPALAYIPKLIVPFTRIVSNILNEKLNYTPVGAFRAWKAGESGRLYGQDFDLADPQLKTEQAALYAKAIMGTAAVASLATLAAQNLHDPDPKFAVTGNGPATPEERKQLMATGWRPNSLKIGPRYINYARTPVGYGLAVIGNYFDAARYKKVDQLDALNRLAYAAKGIPQIIVQQSFLEGVGNLLDAMSNEQTKHAADGAERWLAKQAGSFAIPNALRQVDRAFDPTVYTGAGMKGLLLSQVPFLRRAGQPALNALGEPVKSGVFSYDTAPETEDEVWRMLAAKQAWLPALPPEILVGNKKNPDTYRALTPDEKYRYQQTTGPQIRAALEDRLWDLNTMEPASARAAVEKIARDVHEKAKANYR